MLSITSVPQIEEIIQAVNIVITVKKKMDSSNYISEIMRVKGYDYKNKKYILEDLIN